MPFSLPWDMQQRLFCPPSSPEICLRERFFARVYGTLTIANGLGAALGTWVAGFIHDQVKSYLPSFVLVIACFLLSAYLIGKATTQEVKEVSAIR